ncbi:hypothetical protein CHH28_04310 [Bacterioplanes sanyensis]|uniref:Uncharacterized protein n=1 Tax=Bacterioplanes sanyensis TaxID=1249553 RepID=A0A222FG27_9GAMM|nr:hypothetical protein [Bacterioplanes sanyensis]ASP37948.1 hypothetical protein CHH28_04310 [Bacterioplanes sanyensis]
MLINTHLLLTLATSAAVLLFYLSHRNQVVLHTPLSRSVFNASVLLLLVLFGIAASQGISTSIYWCSQLMMQAFLLPALLYLAKRSQARLTGVGSEQHD